MVQGVIFDLDGTLVESNLDFDLIRREMALPAGATILEALREMPPESRRRCQDILEHHEERAARTAVALPGVRELLDELRRNGIPRAVLTRNSRRCAASILQRLGFDLFPLISRDDGPAKPDPWAISQICRIWGIPTTHAVMIGDFYLDVECGRRAGCRTVLIAKAQDLQRRKGASNPDFVVASLQQRDRLWAWLRESESLPQSPQQADW